MGVLTKLNDYEFLEIFEEVLKNRDEEKLSKVKVALQAFVNEPKIVLAKKKIQAASVSTDFDVIAADAFNVTVEEDNFDLGYERAFRSVTLGERQDFWEIYNVENGITFKRVEEGARIEMDTISGEKTAVYVDYYGGALGFTDKMIRFRKVPAMLDMARLFRNKFWVNKADNHYALLSVAAALNVTAYQGAVADGELQRDIQTINQAAYTLTNRCKDKGFGDMANAKLILYANPRDKNRILAAMRATTRDTAAAGRTGVTVDYNIEVIFTFNQYITARSPILVIPGNKIQKADAMAPTTYTAQKDPFTLNEAQAVWAIYGAVVADTDQCQELTLG